MLAPTVQKMSHFEFLNVDLEIHSRSALEPLLSELSTALYVLYSESKPHKQFANLEVSRSWKNPSPDKTIAALCDALESLSPKARKVWKKAHGKVFDIGFDIDPKASHLHQPLSNNSLRRIANLGGTIIFTCYNPANFKKSPKPVKAKIVKRKGTHPVGDIGRPITRDEITKALNKIA